ncbi:MAG: hypothetical protein ACI4NJ_08400 [Cellvibrio sp.]
MAITYSDQKKQEWESFKISGGTITFEIDPEDISVTKDFETYPSIQPNLTTGFQLPPTTLINSPELQALIQIHGSQWDYILCRVYLSGGNVIYKKLNNGKYEATCNIPAI